MRFRAYSPFSSLLLLLISSYVLLLTGANPFTVEHTTTYTVTLPLSPSDPHSNHTHVIEERGCANPCGYYGQVCCQAGESCFTNANNQAECGTGGGGSGGHVTANAGGSWETYTTIWVETDLVTMTSTYSSYLGGYGGMVTSTYCPTPVAGATATAAAAMCNWNSGESSCGNICCPSGQYCQVAGQCAPAAGGSVSAPLRPTSSGTYSVVTQTSFSTTTTVPFIAPVATGQNVNITSTEADNGGGLSGGAIAGIVIGVILGLILLILLALFLCARSLFLTIFGRRRNRRKETIVEESYHRRSGGGGSRRWYGAGSNKPRRVVREERTTRRGFGPAALGGGLAGAFGFRKGQQNRERDRRRRYDKESEYSSEVSYSTYSGTGM